MRCAIRFSALFGVLFVPSLWAFEFSIVDPQKVYPVGAEIEIRFSFTEQDRKDNLDVKLGVFRKADDADEKGRTAKTLSVRSDKSVVKLKLPIVEGKWHLRAKEMYSGTPLGMASVTVKQLPTPGSIAMTQPKGREATAGELLKFKVSHEVNRAYLGGVLWSPAEGGSREVVTTILAILPTEFGAPDWAAPEHFNSDTHAKPIDVRRLGATETNAGSSVIELEAPRIPGEYAAFLLTRTNAGILANNREKKIGIEPFVLDRFDFYVEPVPVKRLFATLVDSREELGPEDLLSATELFVWAEFAKEHPGFPETIVAELPELSRGPIEFQANPVKNYDSMHRAHVRKASLLGTNLLDHKIASQYQAISGKEGKLTPKGFEDDTVKVSGAKPGVFFDGLRSLEPIDFQGHAFASDTQFYKAVDAYDELRVALKDARTKARELMAQVISPEERERRRKKLKLELKHKDKIRAEMLVKYPSEDGEAPTPQYQEVLSDWARTYDRLENLDHLHDMAILQASAQARRAQALEIRRLRTLLEFCIENEPRIVRSIQAIQGGVVKYRAEWRDSESLIERSRRLAEFYQATEQWELTVNQVMENQARLEEEFAAIDGELQVLMEDYASRAYWEHLGDAFTDSVTAIASSLTTGGAWGLFAEAGYHGARLTAYQFELANDTWFTDFERKFPTVLHEIAVAYGAMADHLKTSHLDPEVQRGKKRIALYRTPAELTALTDGLALVASSSYLDTEAKRAQDMQQDRRDAKQEGIDLLPSSKSWIPTDTGLDFLNFNNRKYACVMGSKTALKMSYQPPGTRRLQADFFSKFNSETGEAKRFFSVVKPKSPIELGKQAAGSPKKVGTGVLTGVAITAAFQKINDICKRTVIHELGDDSRELLEGYLVKELEWFAARRQLMAHSEVVDIVVRGYIEAIYAKIEALLLRWPSDLEKPKRTFELLVDRPFNPEDPIEVDIELDRPGFIAPVFLSPKSEGRKYERGKGFMRFGKQRVVSINLDKPIESQRLVVPAGFVSGDKRSTWLWTLDVDPGTPILRLDEDTFKWHGAETGWLADDRYLLHFASDAEFVLRDGKVEVKALH